MKQPCHALSIHWGWDMFLDLRWGQRCMMSLDYNGPIGILMKYFLCKNSEDELEMDALSLVTGHLQVKMY
ncbi:hypothetical protein ACHAWX_003099 [Stephanocyclus meneghinianus]